MRREGEEVRGEMSYEETEERGGKREEGGRRLGEERGRGAKRRTE